MEYLQRNSTNLSKRLYWQNKEAKSLRWLVRNTVWLRELGKRKKLVTTENKVSAEVRPVLQLPG